MATGPVVRAKPEQVTVAVSTVVVFGTLTIFLYPALYSLNLLWLVLPPGRSAFGIYAGSTIHEVAQVFAAGRSVSMEMAALGLSTHVRALRQAGIKPLLLGSLLFTWLIIGRGAINALLADCLH
jgi:uncharacterized membrane protein YadS